MSKGSDLDRNPSLTFEMLVAMCKGGDLDRNLSLTFEMLVAMCKGNEEKVVSR